MSENRIEQEFIEDPKEKRDWRPHINYEWVVKNLPFILFLSLIALLYIANGHYAVKNIREINKLSQEVKELNWRYIDAKSDLMSRSKMSEVSQGVSNNGLQVPLTPPLNIQSNKDK
ncbi:MAG: FtsL-like putative cell division protein [Chitinophagaceae bacterium]